MKPNCIIVDLEGTITDCYHRMNHWLCGEYKEWNDKFMSDTPNISFINTILKIYRDDPNIQVVISTAKKRNGSEVENWLLRNTFEDGKKILRAINVIYYRDDNDDRPSVEVKQDILNKIKKEYNVIGAYDDRIEICEMYIKNNIMSHLVEIIPGVAYPLFEETTKVKKDHHMENTPDILLEKYADIFRDRNAEYGDGYKDFGNIMMGLFQNGLTLSTAKDFSRFAMLNILVAKIDRYCKNFSKGGHKDSLSDVSVYAAMLQEVDND